MASSPEYTPSTYAPSTPEYTPSAPEYMSAVLEYSPTNPGIPVFSMPPSPKYIPATPEYILSGSVSPEYASATSEFYTPATSCMRPPAPDYTPNLLEDTATSEYAPSNPGIPGFYMLPSPEYVPVTPEYTPLGSISPEYASASATSEFYTPTMSYMRPPTPDYTPNLLEDTATSEYAPSNPGIPGFYMPPSPEYVPATPEYTSISPEYALATSEFYTPAMSYMQPPTPDYTPNPPEYTTATSDFYTPSVLEHTATSEYAPSAAADLCNMSSPEFCQPMSTPEDYAPLQHNLYLQSSLPEYTPSIPEFDMLSTLESTIPEYTPSIPEFDMLSILECTQSRPDYCPPYESYYPQPLEHTQLALNFDLKLPSEYTPTAPNLDLKLSSEYTSAPNLDLKL